MARGLVLDEEVGLGVGSVALRALLGLDRVPVCLRLALKRGNLLVSDAGWAVCILALQFVIDAGVRDLFVLAGGWRGLADFSLIGQEVWDLEGVIVGVGCDVRENGALVIRN